MASAIKNVLKAEKVALLPYSHIQELRRKITLEKITPFYYQSCGNEAILCDRFPGWGKLAVTQLVALPDDAVAD